MRRTSMPVGSISELPQRSSRLRLSLALKPGLRDRDLLPQGSSTLNESLGSYSGEQVNLQFVSDLIF